MADKKKKDSELSYDELVAKLNKTKKDYMDIRFQAVVGHVDNPLQKRTLRREIARLNTLIHQHDLEKIRAAAREAITAGN
ncbi:MAG: 50S ribosomal protein L29 [Treponema sp.]|nr:50S ribosomal protein L29 [Treponema sp.]